MSTHIFFCILPDCGLATLRRGTPCMEHTGCPDCGNMGAVSLGSIYCHRCQMLRSHSCERNRYCCFCKTFYKPLSEDEENTGLCYDCVERAVPSSSEHVCNGEMDYELGHKICDDCDDLLCPQHLSLVESCNTCGCTAEFRDGERVCWCDSCQRTGCDYKHHCSGENEYRSDERLCEYRDDPRCPQHSARRNSIVSPRACADCGEKPEDDHFPCFRGDEPLCAHCEEEAYGPRSPEERRERTGRCCQCNCSFELICSSDRKDLCYKCK